MSHLASLFNAVTHMFCDHEWARRREPGRMYLECVHCLATTPGIEMTSQPSPSRVSQPRALKVAEAA